MKMKIKLKTCSCNFCKRVRAKARNLDKEVTRTMNRKIRQGNRNLVHQAKKATGDDLLFFDQEISQDFQGYYWT
jgi:hypothetical protein